MSAFDELGVCTPSNTLLPKLKLREVGYFAEWRSWPYFSRKYRAKWLIVWFDY